MTPIFRHEFTFITLRSRLIFSYSWFPPSRRFPLLRSTWAYLTPVTLLLLLFARFACLSFLSCVCHCCDIIISYSKQTQKNRKKRSEFSSFTFSLFCLFFSSPSFHLISFCIPFYVEAFSVWMDERDGPKLDEEFHLRVTQAQKEEKTSRHPTINSYLTCQKDDKSDFHSSKKIICAFSSYTCSVYV